MSMILEADDTGALRLPSSLLPHPGPHRLYRVAADGAQVVVAEAESAPPKPATEPRRAWIERLRQTRERNATGREGMPLQQMLDEIREDRR